MDPFILQMILTLVGMVVLIAVLIWVAGLIVAKKQNVSALGVDKKDNKKAGGMALLYILGIILILVGILLVAFGGEMTGGGETVGRCYKCNGSGKIFNGIIYVTCSSCNGFGGLVIEDSGSLSFNATGWLGLLSLLGGIIAVAVGFTKLKKYRQQAADNVKIPSAQKPLSEYAIQVRLYDTSGAATPQQSNTRVRMQYTFTDAQTGELLGRGTQFQTLTLNVDKPTKIKVQLRGFKTVYLNYTPKQGAKYKIVPDIYRGILIYETGSFEY